MDFLNGESVGLGSKKTKVQPEIDQNTSEPVFIEPASHNLPKPVIQYSPELGEIPTLTERSSEMIKELYKHIQNKSTYEDINKTIISNKNVPTTVDEVPPNSREYLKHQFAATATILRPRKIYTNDKSEVPNSLIDVATGGGKTLLMAVTTRLFLQQNERNMAVLMVPDFTSNVTILKEINDLLSDTKFAMRQPPVYERGDRSISAPLQMYAHEDFDPEKGSSVLFHSACSRRLNRTKNSKERVHSFEPVTYITDGREEEKQNAFNQHVNSYFEKTGHTIKDHDIKDHLTFLGGKQDWSYDERNLEWSRLWAHAYAYEDSSSAEEKEGKDKSTIPSRFQDYQYKYTSSTGSGSMFTDVLKALAAGQEVLVIIDEFHTIYEDESFPMIPGKEYRKRLQRFVEYLAIHPNVRLVILTATPAIQKDAMQVYLNTLVSRQHLIDRTLSFFNGSPDMLLNFDSKDSLIAKMSVDSKLHLFHKINGNLNTRNKWTGRKGLVECTLPPIPSELFNADSRSANDFSKKAKEYKGILIYQHGPDRIQKTRTPSIVCNSNAQYNETIQGLRTFFGSGVTFVQVGNKVCHLPSNSDWKHKNDLIGQHLSYKEIAVRVIEALTDNKQDGKQNSVERGDLLQICKWYVEAPEKPSPSSWVIRFLIKTTIAAFRLKYVRDTDQRENKGSPCRTLIMIEEDFREPEPDDKEVKLIGKRIKHMIVSYNARAEIVLCIIQNVYKYFEDNTRSEVTEKINIVEFSELCPDQTPVTGVISSSDLDAVVGVMGNALFQTNNNVSSSKVEPSKTIKTNITFIPSPGKNTSTQVECILSQSPHSPPERVAHIYVTSMAWKKSIDLKQFALQQIIASVDVCASAKQALGRIRRLNCMKGQWTSQPYSRLELYLDDADANNHPFKKTKHSNNALLHNCNTEVRPLMSALFNATNEISGIPLHTFEEFNKEYVQDDKNDFIIHPGKLNRLRGEGS